ncbi:hypothetical protein MNV49_002736 [Pseudohyphozyma bogoriensis]|nr:hypothetical protein MNV49_002736 [Pseudohyphozyma bogoriensis]
MSTASSSISLAPPFTAESAAIKVKKAQDLWNSKVALAYTEDSIWRNRDEFFVGRGQIVDFLTKKWEKETEYKLRKRLFAFEGNRIAVQFWYEFYNADLKTWRRTYGLEHWTFADDGLMKKRHMSGNEISIGDDDRWFKPGVDVDAVEISDVHG